MMHSAWSISTLQGTCLLSFGHRYSLYEIERYQFHNPLSVRVGLPQKRDGDGEGEQKRLNLARAVQVVITKLQVV